MFNAVTPLSCCINNIVRTSCQDNNILQFFFISIEFPSLNGPARGQTVASQTAWRRPGPWLVIPHSSPASSLHLPPQDCQAGSALALSKPWFIVPICPPLDYICQKNVFPGKLAKKTGDQNPGKNISSEIRCGDWCGLIVPDSPHRIRTSEVHGWDRNIKTLNLKLYIPSFRIQ